MLMSLLAGCHGLSGNDPIFYFDIKKNEFKHIYYDGMFFANYDVSYLCDDHFKDKFSQIKKATFKYRFIKEIEDKIDNNKFKAEIFEYYKNNTANNSIKNFNKFWNKFLIKFNYFKNNKSLKKNTPIKADDVSIDEKLSKLNFYFPLIYSYSKNGFYHLCVKWPKNSNIKLLINNKNQIINKKNFNACKLIKPKMARLISLEKIIFKTLDKKIKIYPVILGNINEESIFE